MKGTLSAQKASQGSKTKELMGGTKGNNIFPNVGSLTFSFGKLLISFLQRQTGQKRSQCPDLWDVNLAEVNGEPNAPYGQPSDVSHLHGKNQAKNISSEGQVIN